MKRIATTLVLPLLLSTARVDAGPRFAAKDGLLVIEVESTSSSLGDWKVLQTIEGYTGGGHLEFTGNGPAGGPASSPLAYAFTVDMDGDYQLLIRAHKRLDGEQPDKCNDCYVRLEGDFGAGGSAPLEFLGTDTKLYGGNPEGWGWTAQLDRQHKKYPPVYKLKAGERYTLTISGRSQRFNMDRIVFKHVSVADDKARAPAAAESLKTEKQEG